ncbi:MAG: glycosyltransferase [Acidimicrobiales bacterium]|nr:glycosyltransferase [Acidimicrobiales bacterium]
MRPLRTLLAVAIVPTAVDVGLLVALRQGVGLPLIVADLLAIAVASVVSYSLHRVTTYRSNPFYRWVRHPGAFALIAIGAGLVDALVLRLTFAATGYETAGALVVAKLVALCVAIPIRAAGYRFVLSEEVVEHRQLEPQPRSSGSLRLTVVVPAYREVERIAATVGAIRSTLVDVADDGGVEIIVVDDGSGDGTGDRAMDAGADQVVVLPANRGKGAAVRAGLQASRGRAVAFLDADLAYSPDHLLVVLEEIEEGWDVVIGNRRHPDSETAFAGSGLRSLGSRAVNRLAALALLAAPLDTQCGLKGFRGDVARTVAGATRIDGFAFDIEILHLVERAGWSLCQVPVRLDDTGRASTVRVLADVVLLTRDLLRIRWWASTGAYGADFADGRVRIG